MREEADELRESLNLWNPRNSMNIKRLYQPLRRWSMRTTTCSAGRQAAYDSFDAGEWQA